MPSIYDSIFGHTIFRASNWTAKNRSMVIKKYGDLGASELYTSVIFDGNYNFEKWFSRKVSIVPLSRERENSSLTHHFWSCKRLDKVILGPSTLQEVFWTSLSCSHLHRFVSSTQSLTLWSGCHGQQEHYGQQGLCEQDCFRRDDSNNK